MLREARVLRGTVTVVIVKVWWRGRPGTGPRGKHWSRGESLLVLMYRKLLCFVTSIVLSLLITFREI